MSEQYVKVYDWMWKTGLPRYELLVYAMIYGMTKAGKPFSGSTEWLADYFEMSVRMAKKVLLSLTEKGYVTRRPNGRSFEYLSGTTVPLTGHSSSPKEEPQFPKEEPQFPKKGTTVPLTGHSSSPDNIIDIKRDIKRDTKVSSSSIARASARVRPPNTEEVAAFCREKGYAVNVQRFMAYNESKGWRIGGTKVEDWRQLVELWVSNGADDADPVAEPVHFEDYVIGG